MIHRRGGRGGSVRSARSLRLDGGLGGGGLIRLLDVDLRVRLELFAPVGGDGCGKGGLSGLEVGSKGLAEGDGEEDAILVSTQTLGTKSERAR